VPIQEAMKNGKPTCIEFYTEWCKDCKVILAWDWFGRCLLGRHLHGFAGADR